MKNKYKIDDGANKWHHTLLQSKKNSFNFIKFILNYIFKKNVHKNIWMFIVYINEKKNPETKKEKKTIERIEIICFYNKFDLLIENRFL